MEALNMYFHEILFYNGDENPPAYYLIDGIQASSPEDIIANQLSSILSRVRETFGLGPEISDRKVRDSLYVLQEGGLFPARETQ